MSDDTPLPTLEAILGTADAVEHTRLFGTGPAGQLPLTPAMLRDEPSGTLFGISNCKFDL